MYKFTWLFPSVKSLKNCDIFLQFQNAIKLHFNCEINHLTPIGVSCRKLINQFVKMAKKWY